MRTIAIINQKGGCGKTTTAINLAAVLAQKGYRTLLVDVDPQGHCALGLAVPDQQMDRSVADVMRAGLDGSMAFSDIVWQIAQNLDLAPSSMALAGLEQELAGAPDRDRRLMQVLATVSDHYDYCLIDCPPSIGLLTFNALRAAQEVIIPVETGYFAMQGAIRQEATIRMLTRRAGHRVRFSVLASMYDVRTKLAREILAELRRHFGAQMLPVVVHFNSKLREAASFGQAITEYDPSCTGYEDFANLAEWLIHHPPEPAAGEAMAGAEMNLTGGGATSPAAGAPAASPALSRAAELVERARALAARTAVLSAHFAREAVLGGGKPSTRPEPVIDPSRTQERIPAIAAERLPNVSGMPGMPVRRPPGTPTENNPPAPWPGNPVQVNAETGPRVESQNRPTATDNALAPGAETPTSPLQPAASLRPMREMQNEPGGVAVQTGTAAEPVRTLDHKTTLEPKPVEVSAAGVTEAVTERQTDLARKIAKLYGVRSTSQGLLFIQPLDSARTLAVAGDFNHWNPNLNPLKRDERLGIWQACIKTPAGRYRYRLVVDGKWLQDPFNSYVESNPFGELNNIVETGMDTTV